MLLGLTASGLVLAPMSADAAASAKKEKQKAQQAAKKFNKALKNGAPAGKVIAAAKKYARLKPKKSVAIFKKANNTLPPATNKQALESLQKVLDKIINNSHIPDKAKAKIIAAIQKIIDKIPTPTPTPYQARAWTVDGETAI